VSPADVGDPARLNGAVVARGASSESGPRRSVPVTALSRGHTLRRRMAARAALEEAIVSVVGVGHIPGG